MEKHVGLNPAWFEPGPDGVSPFERISATVGFGSAGTAAAFRALLATEVKPPALQVGDVDKDAEIARLTGERDAARAEVSARNSIIDELRAVVDNLRSMCSTYISERNALRAEVELLTEQRDYNAALWVDMKADRDALQARIDGGVRVWSIDGKDWSFIRCLSDNHSALLLDARPIAEADERKGKADRRETYLSPKHYDKRDYKITNLHATIECARSNDRRRTAGTIADRGQAS